MGDPYQPASKTNGDASARRRAKNKQPVQRTPWLLLIPVCIFLPYLLSKLHYHLPSPQPPRDAQGRVQPSEEIVLQHIQALENIGYRTVGTEEAQLGEQYVLDEVRKIEERCKANGVLNCETFVQRGQGYHMFSIMGHDVLKVYSGIQNVIFKVSAKKPPSGRAPGNDTILLGAHIDSTITSPGAADDGMGVGVMLDIARVLIDRNEPFDNSVLFMWNGAEETLQDGSHMYSTQHPTGKDVRAVINLEAAGSTGGALLFQATSQEMIEAFSHAPYPRGTVIAADVFSSGILLSDTDFGQFEEYLHVSGLDMAIVGHSYFYHTHKDTIAHIERGSSQHFTSNVMAILDHLLSPESPLSKDEPWSPPNIVFMSLYDRVFFSWTMENATRAYVIIATAMAAITIANLRPSRMSAFAISFLSSPLGVVAGILVANAVAVVFHVTGKRMEWFSHEGLPVMLYGPAGALGQVALQYYFDGLLAPANRVFLEQAHYYSQLVWMGIWMLVIQSFGIRSAYLFAGLGLTLLVGAALVEYQTLVSGRKPKLPFVSAYIVPLSFYIALAIEAYTTTLDIFVPLTGRMGYEAPVEFLIATITSACTLIFFPIMSPMFARLPRKTQRSVLACLLGAILCVGALFVSPLWSPFDAMHPKRAGVQYLYNHTSGESSAHLAFMDPSGNYEIASRIHDVWGQGSKLERTKQDDYNSDWDWLYPVSAFLDTYRFPLHNVTDPDFKWPDMPTKATREKTPEGHTRIHLVMEHKGLVWPGLAFEADLVDWSFDFEPPHGRKRHHIKAATSVDEHILELELIMRLEDDEKFKLHWNAVDLNQMVPGTSRRLGPDMPASKWLTALDQWAREEYNDSLDIVLGGAVAGIISV